MFGGYGGGGGEVSTKSPGQRPRMLMCYICGRFLSMFLFLH
jgi:hypothetical protein